MRANRLELLARVGDALDARKSPFAMIGAAALAIRGVARTTFDIDLLTTDESVLDPAAWAEFAGPGARVDVRKGDADDPLAGIVGFDAEEARPVDLVVGKHRWQQAIVERAPLEDVFVARMRVAEAPDIILLKLDAGSPQDVWDIHQLLALADRDLVIATVNDRVAELPEAARVLWGEIRRRAR